MAAKTQANRIHAPPHAEPPALRINRAHGDTAGLERLLLQLAENRAGSDARLGAALDELRALLRASSNGAAPAQPAVQSNPSQHIEALEQRVADLARRVQNSEAAQSPSDEPPAHPDLNAQFRELNAALEASLNIAPAPEPPVVDPNPPAAGLLELQAIADRLESIDHAVKSTGARSGRIEAIEAQLAEVSDAIQALSPQIEQIAHQAAVRVAFQFEESQQTAQTISRLDAIRQDLKVLTQRAGRMDERTLETLETISGTLQHLAQRIAVAEDAAMDEAEGEENPPGDSRRATKNPEQPELELVEPAPAKAAEPVPAEHIEPDEAEPVAIEAPAAPARRLASEANRPGDSRRAPNKPGDSRRTPNKPGDSRRAPNKPGKILVIAAVALLILSAGLLYSRLNTGTGGPPGADHHLAPTPAEPSADHEGSHAAQPGPGGGAEDGNPEIPAGREKTQKPAPKRETIPATRFDRASLITTDPRPFAPGLILKSQSH